MELNTDSFARVVLVGDSSTGKTSIISRLVSGAFCKDEQTTIGAMFVLHDIIKQENSAVL